MSTHRPLPPLLSKTMFVGRDWMHRTTHDLEALACIQSANITSIMQKNDPEHNQRRIEGTILTSIASVKVPSIAPYECSILLY